MSVSYSVVRVALYLPDTSGNGFFPHEPPQLPAHEIADEPGSSTMSNESKIVVTPSTSTDP